MKNEAKRNSILMILLLICTITIIWTNYIFIQNAVTNINENNIKAEYEKIWWKENYLILQELQKQELLEYIDSLKKEKPKMIEDILSKYKERKFEYFNLKQEDIKTLKSTTYTSWNNDAKISLIEFSDLECPYCIEQHNSWIIEELIETNSWTINYMFKNFPLASHQNSEIEAIASKCIEKDLWWEKYLEYIDNIFKETKWAWEWFNLEQLISLAWEFWIEEEKFSNCLEYDEIKKEVQNEFIEWMKLWIEAVPTNIILNNNTWDFYMISWKTTKEEIQEIIDDIK